VALSAFDDKTQPPSHGELRAALGESVALWEELKALVGREVGPLTEEWGYTSKSTGWGLRLKRDNRVILYMTPRSGHFLASLVLGEKAFQLARRSTLSAATLALLETTKKYAEGRGIRIEVHRASDVRDAARLAELKLAR
jgi:hypothetical protein